MIITSLAIKMVFIAALEWIHKETIHPITFTRWYSNYNNISDNNQIASDEQMHVGERVTKAYFPFHLSRPCRIN